jgi:hypothetical protein
MRVLRSFGLIALWILAAAAAPSPHSNNVAISDTATLADPQQQWGGFDSITTYGYAGPGDHGGGLWKKIAGTCTVDGVLCVKDGANNYFQKQDFRATIEETGVVTGSVYDCSKTTGAGAAGCTAFDAKRDALLAAVTASHKTGATTDGLIVKQTTPLTLPSNVTLDCGLAWIGNKNSDGDLTNLPGTIYTGAGASLKHSAGSGYHNCAAVSAAYAAVAPFGTIRAEMDFWGQGGTAQTNADTGFVCDVTGCNDSNDTFNGYDVGLQNSTSGDATFDVIEGDANVGLAAFANNGSRRYNGINVFPFTTRGLKNVVDGTGANTWNDSNSEWWTVTGIVDDGTGHCAIQSTEHSLVDIHTGDLVLITTLPIREGCQGKWTVTKSGSNIVLNGSSFAGPTTTGTFVAGKGIISGLANDANISPGQTITGVAGITDGTAVLHVDHISHFAVIDCGSFVGCANVTGSGSGVSIPFANSTGTLHGTTCHPPKGGCMIISPGGRFVAGNSAGGLRAANLATGMMFGGPDSEVDKDAGAIVNGAQVFGHEVQYRIRNALHPSLHQISGDTDGTVNDPTQVGMWIDGEDEAVDISGRALGKLGIGLELNNVAGPQRCVHFATLGADVSDGDFVSVQVDDGCLNLDASHATTGDILLGHLSGPTFLGNNSFPNGCIYAETDQARSLIMGGANVFECGYAPVTNNNTDSAKAGTAGSITAGSDQITGATFDTTGLVVGMTIIPPNGKDLRHSTEIEALTAAPCTPSCAVTMTAPAKLTDTGTFTFRGLIPPQAEVAGMQRRLVGRDGGNAFDEIDSYGGAPGTIGVRTDGTLGQPTAVQNNESLFHIGGRGYGATAVSPNSRAIVDLKACEGWTDTAQCGDVVVSTTEAGTTTTAERARFESGGLGIGTGAGVGAPFEIIQAAQNYTLSDINALGTGTGDVTLSGSGTIAPPSPGTMYVEHEWISYTKKSGTQVHVTGRALFGSTAVAHANGLPFVYAVSIFVPSTSDIPVFAVLSDGTVINQMGGKRTTAATTVTLTNPDCGSAVPGSAAGKTAITAPPSPAYGCRIRPTPGLFDATVDFNGKVLRAPCYGGHDVSILPVPFTIENGFLDLSYDSVQYDITGYSRLLYSTMCPGDDQLNAIGQVQLTHSAGAFVLSQYGGPGGIELHSQMHVVPSATLTLQDSETTSSATNYLYADECGAAPVTGTSNPSGSTIRIALTCAILGIAPDKIMLHCHSIHGTLAANGAHSATVVDPTHADITDGAVFDSAFVSSGTPLCRVTLLTASTTAPVTVDGILVKPGGVNQALVGTAPIGGAHAYVSHFSTYHGAELVAGAIKSDGAGNFSQAACANLSNAAEACSTPGLKHSITASIATATGTGEQILDSYSLPANSLDNAGRNYRIEACYLHAANTNTVTSRLYFGSEVISDTGVSTTGSVSCMWIAVLKTGSNTQNVIAGGTKGAVSPVNLGTNYTAATETDSSTITIKATIQDGTSSAADGTLILFTVKALN